MAAPATIAYVIDPRFTGGTSAAVASEIRETARIARVSVHAVETRMFQGQTLAPPLESALADLGIRPIWNSPSVAADLVIVHNPSFLKYEAALPMRIAARDLVVVAHENFLRPPGSEPFDVAHCLGLLDRASLALRKIIAPISAHNRTTVTQWLARPGTPRAWQVLGADWTNICAFTMAAPTDRPADRRGRHSRPSFEKFPSLAAMDLCFPRGAANVILGGDGLRKAAAQRPHWTLYRFNEIDVGRYFGMIDFMVYFTAPTYRESFGRVLAEGIAAGKVVISDAETASTFDSGIHAATPQEVDQVIAGYIADPARYRAQVTLGQDRLARFSAPAFRERLRELLG